MIKVSFLCDILNVEDFTGEIFDLTYNSNATVSITSTIIAVNNISSTSTSFGLFSSSSPAYILSASDSLRRYVFYVEGNSVIRVDNASNPSTFVTAPSVILGIEVDSISGNLCVLTLGTNSIALQVYATTAALLRSPTASISASSSILYGLTAMSGNNFYFLMNNGTNYVGTWNSVTSALTFALANIPSTAVIISLEYDSKTSGLYALINDAGAFSLIQLSSGTQRADFTSQLPSSSWAALTGGSFTDSSGNFGQNFLNVSQAIASAGNLNIYNLNTSTWTSVTISSSVVYLGRASRVSTDCAGVPVNAMVDSPVNVIDNCQRCVAVGSQCLTSGMITTSPLTTSPLTTSPLTSGDITTSPVTTSYVTTSPVTSSPLTSSEITSSPLTTSPVTTSPVTTSPVTTVSITSSFLTTAELTTIATPTTVAMTTGVSDNLQSPSEPEGFPRLFIYLAAGAGGLLLILIMIIIAIVASRNRKPKKKRDTVELASIKTEVETSNKQLYEGVPPAPIVRKSTKKDYEGGLEWLHKFICRNA